MTRINSCMQLRELISKQKKLLSLFLLHFPSRLVGDLTEDIIQEGKKFSRRAPHHHHRYHHHHPHKKKHVNDGFSYKKYISRAHSNSDYFLCFFIVSWCIHRDYTTRLVITVSCHCHHCTKLYVPLPAHFQLPFLIKEIIIQTFQGYLAFRFFFSFVSSQSC